MFQRIVVALDGTEFSEQALGMAAAIARRTGSELALVTAEIAPPALLPDVGLADRVRGAASDYLDGVADRLSDAGVTKVTAEVLSGDPSEAIEEYRSAQGADLTVMSTHGRGALARAWLGSVADRFARSTRAPVLLVRPSEDGPATGPSNEPATISRILVTLDGSELSESALAPAEALATIFGAEMVLTNLVEYPDGPESIYLPDAIHGIEVKLEERRRGAEAELESLVGDLAEEGITTKAVSRVVTRVAEGILEVARDEEADLIVMASHGHGGVRRLILGSVTDKVLRGSGKALLVVPARSA
jgi:nucleotide-binding universal stress UspA family protein